MIQFNPKTIGQVALLDDPPFRIFWTPYDPLDLVSGSLDPLGFTRGYLAIADHFLPDLTTVSTVPRYVSMLCAAVAKAEDRFPSSSLTSAKTKEIRLRAIKSYERAWAIACGLASQDLDVGEKAISGLRGVTYVKRRLMSLSARQYLQTSSFNLLSNQVRYGGIGIYSSLIEACHLATMTALSSRPIGRRLAEAFPKPLSNLAVYDEEAKLSLTDLKEWGRRAHIGVFTRAEGTVLAQALRGGEEAEYSDHVRATALTLLAQVLPDGEFDEGVVLGRVLRACRSRTAHEAEAAKGCIDQIRAALSIEDPFERFYQSTLYLFEGMRAAASDEGEATFTSASCLQSMKEAVETCKATGEELLKTISDAAATDAKATAEMAEILTKSGIIALAERIAHAPNIVGVLQSILVRHHSVQSGKFDGGLPKSPWLRSTGPEAFQLTVQRHQLTPAGRVKHWSKIGRHSYRTPAAFEFIRACRIS
ncbi:MAG: hypothetical protein WCH20_16305 [Nitrospira sp.]